MDKVKAFFAQHWLPIVIAIVILIALIVVYFEVFAAGKKSGTDAVVASIPNPSIGDPYSNEELLAVKNYTDWLSGCLHWYSIQDTQQWENFSQEKDRILVGTFNAYALANNGASLYSDINSALWFRYSITGSYISTVLTRLKDLLNI